jgi:cell division protein FtsL
MKLSADLPMEIIKDLWFHRCALLFYLLIVCSLSASIVVTAKTKTEISELRQIEVEEDYLENEWRNLLLEEETLAEHSKVRDVAENQLNMTRPDANNEEHVEIE